VSTARPAPPSLRAFIRETLGCTCPDAVFDVVERTREVATPSRVPFTRWVIGGRLLVYVVAPTDGFEQIAEELAALGRRDRDARGLNRFRLVLASALPEADARAAERAFAGAAGEDAKAHLHCVAPECCEGLLAAG
jgi:hypothetical protein